MAFKGLKVSGAVGAARWTNLAMLFISNPLGALCGGAWQQNTATVSVRETQLQIYHTVASGAAGHRRAGFPVQILGADRPSTTMARYTRKFLLELTAQKPFIYGIPRKITYGWGMTRPLVRSDILVWGQTVARDFAHSLLRLNTEGLERPSALSISHADRSALHTLACAVVYTRKQGQLHERDFS